MSTRTVSDAVFMPSLADRKRDKVRLIANWQPMDDLSLQFSYDDGQDRYSIPTDYSVRIIGASLSGNRLQIFEHEQQTLVHASDLLSLVVQL